MLLNCTPHAIRLVDGDNRLIRVYEPYYTVARCETSRQTVEEIDVYGSIVRINRTTFGQVTGLPEPEDGYRYVVSMLVAQACPNRTDLLIPDETVRDEQGRIVGCRAFARIW